MKRCRKKQNCVGSPSGVPVRWVSWFKFLVYNSLIFICFKGTNVHAFHSSKINKISSCWSRIDYLQQQQQQNQKASYSFQFHDYNLRNPTSSLSLIRSSPFSNQLYSSNTGTALYKLPPRKRYGYGKSYNADDFDIDKFRRRGRKGKGIRGLTSYYSSLFSGVSLQQWLVYFNILFYALQILSAIQYLPTLNMYLGRFGYRPIETSKIVEQNIWGGSPITLRLPTRRISSYGPFTTDFYFVSGRMAQLQPHRYLTAGFLHGSVIHLLLNMQALSRLPPMLERGLGWPLYLASFLASIVSGNVAHNVVTNGNGSPCLGASGGICGLNGLLFSVLRKMGRDKESNVVLNNMFTLVIYGLMSSRVSNAGHIGGFIAGALVGHLFGPNFRKSYVSRRSRWNTEQTEFQNAGLLKPGYTEAQAKIPIKFFYAFAAFAVLTKESLRGIPSDIVRGFLKPGSLGGVY